MNKPKYYPKRALSDGRKNEKDNDKIMTRQQRDNTETLFSSIYK